MPLSSCLVQRRQYFLVFAAATFAAVAAPHIVAQTSAIPPLPGVTLTPFQQKALAASASSGVSIKSAVMTGVVQHTAGSTSETGTVSLRASADGSWTEDWSGATSSRTITCTAFNAHRTCNVTVAGKTQPLTGPTSERALAWFAPWNGIPLISGSFVGATEGIDAQGDRVLTLDSPLVAIASVSTAGKQAAPDDFKNASVSVLYNAASALPSGMHYVEALNSETSNAIDFTVVYDDYRLESGFMLPHHIQRYVQRTLEADIHITSVSLN